MVNLPTEEKFKEMEVQVCGLSFGIDQKLKKKYQKCTHKFFYDRLIMCAC